MGENDGHYAADSALKIAYDACKQERAAYEEQILGAPRTIWDNGEMYDDKRGNKN